MRTLLKIILAIIAIIVVDMVLLNIFHSPEYIITAISVGIIVLLALSTGKPKEKGDSK